MALSHEFTIVGHPSIYDGSERELTIWFSEPQSGVTDETGLLLLSNDFGDVPSSKRYKSIRDQFADEYNLIVVQCNYFGGRFMGAVMNPQYTIDAEVVKKTVTSDEWARISAGNRLNINALMDIGANYSIRLAGHQQQEESLRDFNDMGIMQAIDNLTAVSAVIAILEDNGYHIDYSRILAYGRGHGAYIHYLCNAFHSQLFSRLIDYNAWLFPDYLNNQRVLSFQRGKMHGSIIFDYLARSQPIDHELLHLPSLYRKFENRCQILSFEDSAELTNKGESDKQQFCETVRFAMHVETGGIKEASQRIDSDYVKLFDYVMRHTWLGEKRTGPIKPVNAQFHTPKYRYDIIYTNGMPEMRRHAK